MKHKNGFTIVELLIVIVVIGILAALVLNSFAGAQQKARLASADSGVESLAKGIKKLEFDTGKKAFGCPAEGGVYDAEGAVTNTTAGIMNAPTVSTWGPCSWTASDISSWQGPYITSPKDPWGSDYRIDHDYGICENGSGKFISAVLSMGPDKALVYPTTATSGPCTVNSSDDIYQQLR